VKSPALATQHESCLAPIVDVRDVPLDQLPEDPDARLMVTAIKSKLADPSGIRVASFNSAI
jgi:hypothetical protein